MELVNYNLTIGYLVALIFEQQLLELSTLLQFDLEDGLPRRWFSFLSPRVIRAFRELVVDEFSARTHEISINSSPVLVVQVHVVRQLVYLEALRRNKLVPGRLKANLFLAALAFVTRQ